MEMFSLILVQLGWGGVTMKIIIGSQKVGAWEESGLVLRSGKCIPVISSVYESIQDDCWDMILARSEQFLWTLMNSYRGVRGKHEKGDRNSYAGNLERLLAWETNQLSIYCPPNRLWCPGCRQKCWNECSWTSDLDGGNWAKCWRFQAIPNHASLDWRCLWSGAKLGVVVDYQGCYECDFCRTLPCRYRQLGVHILNPYWLHLSGCNGAI